MSSLLSRISSGFVLEDTFDSEVLHERWQVSPSNHSRYSLTERKGYLRLKHGDPDIFILMSAPRFDFVMEVDTKYVPIHPSDQGGIVAFRDNLNYLELLEYYDPVTGTTYAYDRLRMIRRSDLFEGYGSNDNGKTWDLIGTGYLDAPKIGFVLHGLQEANSASLDIDGIRIYRDTYIHVGNLNPGQNVKLVTPTGDLVGEAICQPDYDHAKINVQNINFPFSGKIQLYDKSGFLLDETEVLNDIWGGDVFWYGIKLDLEMDGILLRQDREYQLGNMQNGFIERRAYVINNNDIPVYNVKASIAALSEYYGWEWADLAKDLFDFPGEYKDKIELGTILPGEKIPIWIKVTRRPNQQIASLHDYKFRIVFESG